MRFKPCNDDWKLFIYHLVGCIDLPIPSQLVSCDILLVKLCVAFISRNLTVQCDFSNQLYTRIKLTETFEINLCNTRVLSNTIIWLATHSPNNTNSNSNNNKWVREREASSWKKMNKISKTTFKVNSRFASPFLCTTTFCAFCRFICTLLLLLCCF